MLSRFALLGLIAFGIYVYSNSPHSKASSATVTQACSAATSGAATVTLAWAAPPAGSQQVWLDVGLSPDFPAGSYQAHGPLDPSQTAYALDGIPSATKLYYRVNVLSDSGWRAAAAGSLTAKCGK
ncbi:MAG: hypothetical protein M3P30_04000 [Chloroflexota bacterium]|nr:hypothetical protein [Chloroflexota bacterium]